MNDDWRLRVDLREAHELADRLEASDLEHDLKTSFHDRVIVSRDQGEVFCYAATREQIDATEKAIRSLAADHGWRIETELKHWHPTAEEWEDPAKPLPSDDAQRAAERAELMRREREESEARGFPAYEVKVRCRSPRDAAQLFAKLRAEGIRSVHRHQFIVLGADDEDSANVLAERIRREAPPGSTVTGEASIREVAADAPEATTFAVSPFAVFGGLGG